MNETILKAKLLSLLKEANGLSEENTDLDGYWQRQLNALFEMEHFAEDTEKENLQMEVWQWAMNVHCLGGSSFLSTEAQIGLQRILWKPDTTKAH